MLTALVQSSLLALQPARDGLLDCLADRTEIGQIWRQSNGTVDQTMDAPNVPQAWSGLHDDKPDPADPPIGVKIRLRVCDVAAEWFSQFHGAPPFIPYRPIEDRDSVIQAMIQFVRKSGSNLADLSPWKGLPGYD
jgi:hypothetical protein